jgi:hypothetical protein
MVLTSFDLTGPGRMKVEIRVVSWPKLDRDKRPR